MLNEKVTHYKRISDINTDNVETIGFFLDGIKNGTWKEEIAVIRKKVKEGKEEGLSSEEIAKTISSNKQDLKCFSMSGTFVGTRSNNNFSEHSGLIQIDIDKCQSREELEKYRNMLINDPHIAFVFNSPSGTGVKAGLRIAKDYRIHAAVHAQAREHFGFAPKDIRWDNAVKDPARVCLVSYDPNIYINENAEEFRVIEKKALPKKNIAKLKYIEDDLRRKWANELFDTAFKMISESADGERHFQRVKAGYLLGGGVAHGLFSESEVMGEMERIVSAYTRLPIEKAMKDVRDGLKNGQSEPLTPPKYIQNRDKIQQKIVEEYKERTGDVASYDDIVGGETEVALKDTFFRLLGKMDGKLYVHPFNIGQPIHFNDFKKQDLIKIAPLHYWQSIYGNDDGKVDWDEAISDTTHSCTAVGFYNPDIVRGRGVWIDNKKTVVNTGKGIVVNGKIIPYQQFKTKYIYTEGKPFDVDISKIASLSDAKKLLTISSMLPFKRDIDHHLFIGQIISSIVCGALDWRSHFWLTAPAGTGKSWTLQNIVSPILGNFAIYPNGEETTEAGIRQTIKGDSVAVIHDETEGETDSGKRNLQKKLVLARQSSSESMSKIMKGTVDGNASTYTVRSSFMFISTAIPIMRRADESRFTVVELRRKDTRRADEERKRFEKLKELTESTISEHYCEMIRARAIAMVDTIRANARVFASVLPLYVGSQRSADQIATMLAGAYILESDNIITEEQAHLLCSGVDFGADAETEEHTEEINCLHTIMSLIPFGKEDSIGDMIMRALHEQAYQDTELRKYGIAVFDDKVFFSTSKSNTNLQKLLEKTPYQDSYIREISRIDGAEKHDKQVKCYGIPHRGVTVPATVFCPNFVDKSVPAF